MNRVMRRAGAFLAAAMVARRAVGRARTARVVQLTKFTKGAPAACQMRRWVAWSRMEDGIGGLHVSQKSAVVGETSPRPAITRSAQRPQTKR